MSYNCGKMNGIQRKHATATASHVDNIHIQRSLFLCAVEITAKFMAKQFLKKYGDDMKNV